MLLRRVKAHIETENWFAVLIDFLIVVGGVFIGVQLGNWNDARMNSAASVNALERLRSEIVTNISTSESMISRIDESLEFRDRAIQALDQCNNEDGMSVTVARAIGLMQGDIVPPLVSNMIDELSRQERHTANLSEDFLIALNRHHGEITDEVSQLAVNFSLMWDRHIIDHDDVSISALSADLATAEVVLNVPLSRVCQDKGFKSRFVRTHIWHESTKMRLRRFRERSDTFLTVLDAELERIR